MDHNHMDHMLNHTGHDHMDHSSMSHDHMDHSTMNHDHMEHVASGHTADPASHSGHGSHHMMMYFHLGYQEMILFEFWDTSTVLSFVLSIIGIFIASILYEGLKYFREHLIMKSYEALKYSSMTSVDRNATNENKKKLRLSMMSPDHFCQTGLHLLQVVISYCLMLVFMTYNVWLCLAVALGSAVGYFMFGWRKSSVVDITEHCH